MFDENNGALVLISGKLDIQDSLKDEKYNVQTIQALRKPWELLRPEGSQKLS